MKKNLFDFFHFNPLPERAKTRPRFWIGPGNCWEPRASAAGTGLPRGKAAHYLPFFNNIGY